MKNEGGLGTEPWRIPILCYTLGGEEETGD